MFKCFQVMDLFHGKDEYEPTKWIDVNEHIPQDRRGLFKVKLSDGNEIYAYFFSDKIHHLCWYSGTEPTYWWDRIEKKPLYNVTHWGERN